MKGQPHGTKGISKVRKIPHGITEELGVGCKINKRGTEEYKETV